MSFQSMRERIKQSGSDLYNEQILDARRLLLYGFQDDVSYNPNITIYDTGESIPIKIYNQKSSATYGFIASYLALHDKPIELGEILHDAVKDEYWLCVESFDVSGIHNEGKLGKCMRFLKWQDEYGVIQEIPIIATSAAKYNNGERGNETITLPSDQLMLYVKMTPDTIKLDRGMRFFMDENVSNPSVYEITRVDTTLYSYNSKGYICILLTECNYTPSAKELELGVCDYVNMPSDEDADSDETKVLKAIISGNNKIRVGYSRTYTLNFEDNDGNVIKYQDVQYEWKVVSNFDVNQTITENKIKLAVDKSAPIGSHFSLQVISNDEIISEILIEVIPVV